MSRTVLIQIQESFNVKKIKKNGLIFQIFYVYLLEESSFQLGNEI